MGPSLGWRKNSTHVSFGLKVTFVDLPLLQYAKQIARQKSTTLNPNNTIYYYPPYSLFNNKKYLPANSPNFLISNYF
jgi:hypothetical protein